MLQLASNLFSPSLPSFLPSSLPSSLSLPPFLSLASLPLSPFLSLSLPSPLPSSLSYPLSLYQEHDYGGAGSVQRPTAVLYSRDDQSYAGTKELQSTLSSGSYSTCSCSTQLYTILKKESTCVLVGCVDLISSQPLGSQWLVKLL